MVKYIVKRNEILEQKDSEFATNILNIIKVHNICIVKNFFTKIEHKLMHKLVSERFDYTKDIRRSGIFYFKMSDYQRLDIGDSYKNPRFARFTLFNEWKKKKQFTL